MNKLTFFFLCALSIIKIEFVFGQNNFPDTIKFIDSLKEASIYKVHGLSLKKYFIMDLNRDGSFEIVERSNRIEEEAPGFLSSNLYYAFVYDRIYSLRNCRYVEDYINYDYTHHLTMQLYMYKFWISIIEKNNCRKIGSGYESEIIEQNRESFLLELNRLIKLYEDRMENNDSF